VARSLRSGKTNTSGLILPDSSNPFFAEVGRSIEDAAYKLGYSVILCNTERDQTREHFYVDVLSKKQVVGIIFVATGDQVDSLNFLLSQELPVVVVDRELPNVEVDSVLTDNRNGGYVATQHLIELGHRRIACIAGSSRITPSAERVTGYRQALADAEIPVEESLILRGDFHPASGQAAATALLCSPHPPTAIFACNDLMALGAIRAAAKAGKRVPEDVSLVGFDDIELDSFLNPPLTTIAQPKTEIGTLAASLLTERIGNKKRPYRKTLLSTRLIVRESTAPVLYQEMIHGV
jgi:LacI family transcriptional regulator